MSHAQELIERARVFDERAERAADPISRQHYREMAAHYRSLSVEHREAATQPERELANRNQLKVVVGARIYWKRAFFPAASDLFPIFERPRPLL
jgi:hypothetical protein